MSKARQRAKALRRRAEWATRNGGPSDGLTSKIRAQHLIDHPDCTYGDQPHFVPPSFGQIGFFMCDPPADLTNHTRCRPPYDHEHPDHYIPVVAETMEDFDIDASIRTGVPVPKHDG